MYNPYNQLGEGPDVRSKQQPHRVGNSCNGVEVYRIHYHAHLGGWGRKPLAFHHAGASRKAGYLAPWVSMLTGNAAMFRAS
jgi:hypothetical protein